MKLFISIWFNLSLLLAVTAAPTACTWACGNKSSKKEIKCKSDCKKECCKKNLSKHKKGKCTNNCNGDCKGNCDCDCTFAVYILDLFEQSNFSLYHQLIDIKEKHTIAYKKRFPKSVYLSFWQPPKIVVSAMFS